MYRRDDEMTPEEIGADLYRKYKGSPFIDKDWVRRSLASCAKEAANRVYEGFYAEEQRQMIQEFRDAFKVATKKEKGSKANE